MNFTRIVTWLSGWVAAHDELVRDGALVYGRRGEKEWPPEGWTQTVSVAEVLGIIDQFGEASAACAEDTTGNERLIHLAMVETLLDLRRHFIQEITKQEVSDEPGRTEKNG